MLAGVKLIDKAAAEKVLKQEERARKEEKKQQKKEKKAQRKQRRKQGSHAEPPAALDSASASSGDEGDARGHPAAADGSAGAAADVGTSAPLAAADDAVAGREDWMTTPMGRSVAAAPVGDAKSDKQQAAAERAAIAASRELNPHFANGGDGVPPPKPAGSAAAAAAPRPAGVGDGGTSWRLKALRRAQATAAEEGKDVREVVAERWGSLNSLTAGLTEQKAAHAKAHMAAARERRQAAGGGEDQQQQRRPDAPGYLQELKADRPQMRRPGGGAGAGFSGAFGRHSRERPTPQRDSNRNGSGSGSRASGGDGGRREAADHGGGGGAGRSGGRDGTPEASASRGAGAAEPAKRPSRGGERIRFDAGGGGGSRADRRDDSGAGRAARTGDGSGGGSGREGSGSRREDVRRGEDSRRGDNSRLSRGGGGGARAQRDPLGRGADGDALRAAAGSLNAFAGDGSFMDQFERQQEAAAVSPPRSPGSRSPSPLTTIEAQAPAVAVDSGAPASPAAGSSPADAAAQPSADGGGGGGGGGGNLSVAAALRTRLMGKAAPAAAAGGAGARAGAGREVELLPSVDAQGRAVAGSFGREAAGQGALPPGRKQKRIQRFGADGQRERWTADDEANPDLNTLLKRQKHEGAADMDAALASNIMKKQRFRADDLNADDEYDFDRGIDMYERKRGDQEKEGKKARAAAIADARRMGSALDACTLCITSARRPRHLTLAIGQASYLMLPARGSLAVGHVCIVPAEHVASARRTDEAVWTELRNFKKSLLQMFMQQDKDVIFMETAVRLDNARTHACIEAVPLPAKAFAKAPLYFKKGIDDAESEWSQHHAKRMIDTRDKGLRGSIPPNFPYFHVEFGLSAGFVHVIDDETKWDANFGRSVLAGLLGLGANVGQATAKAEPEALQRRRAAEFLKAYEPFDWTAQL